MSWIRFKARTAGALIMLLGAWGGIAPFVGPLFGYRMDGFGAWSWTTTRGELSVGAGAVALLGGLLLLAATSRLVQRAGGVLAGLAGTWFVVGPAFLPVWTGSGLTFPGTGTGPALLRAVEAIGFAYGTGALIVALAGYALGALSRAGLRRPAPASGVEIAGRRVVLPEPPPLVTPPPAVEPPPMAPPPVAPPPAVPAPPPVPPVVSGQPRG